MEQRELLLLEKYAAVNPELKELWEGRKARSQGLSHSYGRTDVKTAEETEA